LRSFAIGNHCSNTRDGDRAFPGEAMDSSTQSADAHSNDATDSSRRDARARSIATVILPGLNEDELRVIEVVGLRMLRIGRDTHGPLDIARERRDWKAESAAESADRLFYEACHEIAANHARTERLRCEAAGEIDVRFDLSDDEATP